MLPPEKSLQIQRSKQVATSKTMSKILCKNHMKAGVTNVVWSRLERIENYQWQKLSLYSNRRIIPPRKIAVLGVYALTEQSNCKICEAETDRIERNRQIYNNCSWRLHTHLLIVGRMTRQKVGNAVGRPQQAIDLKDLVHIRRPLRVTKAERAFLLSGMKCGQRWTIPWVMGQTSIEIIQGIFSITVE